ncbi:uncharacterized protein BYT42DRAFT_558864 [Radiomyces spectabilis]|uniref:uncharacterized protein n=1 Tax=Radiomyces spectabilis TaxID=64574 RepID=UPI00221EDC7D|nr:uncharacterized protein BYT42DRAFT_558864 [Radiomyces spectabilis]KAI8388076.1 hypothetical protein BYT42DRAFT_558864 [Radiomyces spectabilis]
MNPYDSHHSEKKPTHDSVTQEIASLFPSLNSSSILSNSFGYADIEPFSLDIPSDEREIRDNNDKYSFPLPTQHDPSRIIVPPIAIDEGSSSSVSRKASSPSSDPSRPPRERRARKAPHELLTEAEKKANHIASEQKRRQNIRLGFDQLIEIVPSLNQGNRSEALILQKSVDHIRHLISVKNDLKAQVRDLQTLLGDS